MSGQNSSKTVAAILKQHQDLVAARDMTSSMTSTQQHIAQAQHRKRAKQKTQVHKLPSHTHNSFIVDNNTLSSLSSSSQASSSSNNLNHTHISTTTGALANNMVFSTESKPSASTTKAPSLTRDLSPSRITAQMKRAMPDGTGLPSNANLLLSALQGNMPDPMGIFHSQKLDNSVTDNNNASIDSWQTSVQSSITSSEPQLINAGFAHSFTPITIFANSDEASTQSSNILDPSNISPTLTTVENLLTLSAGNIQTINVSHVPKITIPASSASMGAGGLPQDGSSPGPSLSSPPFTLSAMEVAQQIRMEANGQSAHALHMQQQLRTQIKGSRSIDAQITTCNQPFSQGGGGVQPITTTASKDLGGGLKGGRGAKEQQPLEVSMPLLAAKLAPSLGTFPVSLKPPQSTSLNENSRIKPGMASTTGRSVLTPSSNSKSGRKSNLNISNDCGQLLRNPRVSGQEGLTLLRDPDNLHTVVSCGPDKVWGFRGEGSQVLSHGFEMKIKSGGSKTLPSASNALEGSALKRSLTQSNTPSSQTKSDMVMGHTLNWNTAFPAKVSNVDKKRAPFDKRNKNYSSKESRTKHLTNHQAALALQRHKAGDSEQTAIDVDLNVGNVGQLTSIVSEEPIHFAKTITDNKVVSNNLSISVNNSQTLYQFTQAGSVHTHSGVPVAAKSKSGTSVFVSNTPVQPITMSIADISVGNKAASIKGPSQNINNILLNNSASNLLSSRINPVTFATSSLTSASSSDSRLSSSSLGDFSKPPSYHESLPPPYPHPPTFNSSQLSRQQQQQLQLQLQLQQPSCSSVKRESNLNPFTFPTTGLPVPTASTTTHHPVIGSHDNHQAVSGSLNNYQAVSGSHANHHAMNTSMSPVKSESGTRLLGQRFVGTHGEMKPPGTHPQASHLTHPQVSHLTHPLAAASSTPAEDDRFKFDDLLLSSLVKEEMSSDELATIDPLNQRMGNLSCFPVMNSTYRAAYRSHAVAVQRARSGVVTSTAKSLDILRQTLQASINKEITEVIRKYTNKYFQPALENIRLNSNEGSLGEEHINYVCRTILEETKCEYMSMSGHRSVTPSDIPDNGSESGSTSGRRGLLSKRGRASDSDSERGSECGFKRKAVKRKGRPPAHISGRATPTKTYKSSEPVKREGPRWDPTRLQPETLFVMGARANKALGLGNTRGRLYIRHPDVFKYMGDQADKMWLFEHNLMPASRGKAYMLLLEDIEDLSRSQEYRDSPGLMMHECVGFTVPDWMLVKMKEQMETLRSDKGQSYSTATMENAEPPQKILPFSAFSEMTSNDIQLSPADTEMDFLSTVDVDDTQPSISPFTMTGGFHDGPSHSLGPSPSPSDLDPLDDPTGSHPNFLM